MTVAVTPTDPSAALAESFPVRAADARANPLKRHLSDVLRARIHWPQGEAVRIAAGRDALGP